MTEILDEKVFPIGDALWQAAVNAIARQTGYSGDDITPDAEFEADLGIDSIILVGILGELSQACGLPKRIDGRGIRTVAQLVEGLRRSLRAGNGHLPDPAFFDMPDTPHDPSHQDFPERGSPDFADRSAEDRPSGPGSPDPGREVETLTAALARIAGQPETYPPADGDQRTMRDFVDLTDRDLFRKTREFSAFYHRRQAEQTYWYGMPLESPCRNRVVIYDEITGRHREYLMFASNNYLGLANHPGVIDAIADAARRFGATNTGCRLIGGSNVLHKELERRLADLKGTDDAILYPSGYSANLGCISALAGPQDLIFTDSLNHMSIQDGCKLSGAPRKIYPHSMESLERALAKSSDHAGGRLIVTDGVFSMHGDVVDLPRLLTLARGYGARVLVDDAHSTGVLGRTGTGTSEHFGLKGQVDLELGTFSKTLSGVGGFVAASGDVVEYLRFYSNSYVFAATIPAPVTAGLIAAIEIMKAEPQRLSMLWSNIHRLRGHLLDAGFDLGNSASAIIPVVIGDDRRTLEFGRAVRARGLFCQTVVFPGVAVGDARLRISVGAEHTAEDIDLAAGILTEGAREVGIPVKG